MKKILLATLIALSIPCAAQAQDVEDYKVSCQTEGTCNTFDVTYEEPNQEIAQTRRTRTRRTRSSEKTFFKDFYVGGGAGIIFGDGLDLGFQGHVFGGSWYNKYVAAEAEITFGFASTEDVTIDGIPGITSSTTIEGETISIIGFFLNPRFQYEFEGSKFTAFAAPGLGLVLFDGNSELGFQVKAGAEYAISEKYDAFLQGRFQTEGDIVGIEGGVIFDL